jgi:hypothetical protein
MSMTAISKRQVLAKFIDKLPPNKGWWFHLPTLASSQLTHPKIIQENGTRIAGVDGGLAIVSWPDGLKVVWVNGKRDT